MHREHDPDVVAGYLQDAARYGGGHTGEVCFPHSEADVAALVREGRPLLVAGAQSSLTGGATPRGEVVVSTSRMTSIDSWTDASVRCGSGQPMTVMPAARPETAPGTLSSTTMQCSRGASNRRAANRKRSGAGLPRATCEALKMCGSKSGSNRVTVSA